MSTSVTYNGTTYAIPTAGELNWPNLTNFLVDVATSGAVTTKQVQTIRVAVTSPVTVGLTDCTVVTKLTVPAAVAVTLPAGVNGQTYIIHDGTGDAATNNVTITPTGSDTISGAATFVLNRSKGAVVLQYSTTGTDWKVLDLYIPPGQGLPADQKALTASRVVVTDGSGLVSASTVTTTELGYVSGVTSAIQTQLNAKQATGNYVTALTGDVTATGPGSVAATVAQVGGKTASAVATSVTDTVAATNLNTNSTIVKRDGSGNFAAGTITAALTGNATTATTAGNVSGTVAIANGGTGQTAQTAAYDALNPNTTKGDLTVRGASNNVRLAIGTNGQVLTSDSTATNGLKWGDASAGAGEINAVSNPSAASATTGAAGDGVAHTVARNTANSPLDPAITTCFAITATANAVEGSTAGVGYTISTFPAGLRGRKNKVEFWITSPSADTWKVSVYTAGGVRQALSTDSSSATTITAGVTGKFTTTFDADATTTSYIVRFTRTAGTGTTTLYVTNLVVGPGIQPQGAVIGSWTSQASYTSITNGAIASPTRNQLVWRRVGGNMEGRFIWGGGSAATSTANSVTFNLPTGYSIDTTAMASTSQRDMFGSAQYLTATAGTRVTLYPVYQSTTSLIFQKQGGTTLIESDLSTGWELDFSISIPIAEWAGGGTVNLASNGTVNASVTCDTPNGHGSTNTKIRRYTNSTTAGTAITYADSATLGGSFTINETGIYSITVSDKNSAAADVLGLSVNTTTPTTAIQSISTSERLLMFEGTSNSNTSGTVTARLNVGDIVRAHDDGSPNSTAAYSILKIVKVANDAGQAVGFAEVVPGTSSGLVSASGLKGKTDGVAVAAGYVGQVISGNGAGTTPVNGSYVNMVTLALTPGVWAVNGTLHYTVAGTQPVSPTVFIAAISKTSATADASNSDGFLQFYNINTITTVNTSSYYKTGTRIINISAAQNVYLVARLDSGTMNGCLFGTDTYAQAVRIA